MSNLAVSLPPLLREGDHLTSAEFLKRWEAMPNLKHAELIDGVVFCMPSPVSDSTAQRDMIYWLSCYMDSTPGCDSGLEATWIMEPSSVPQPDAFLKILPEYGRIGRLLSRRSGVGCRSERFNPVSRSGRQTRALSQSGRTRVHHGFAESPAGDLASAFARTLSQDYGAQGRPFVFVRFPRLVAGSGRFVVEEKVDPHGA